MTKVAILTINDYNNYGNRLQNYALQEVLKDFGCDVDTIVQERAVLSGISSKTRKEKFKNLLAISTSDKMKVIKLNIMIKINKGIIKDKYSNLKEFTCEYIAENKNGISIGNIPDSLNKEYDFFVTGSDQVWNPNFGFGNEIDFLEFADEYKRISFAASFGISVVPEEHSEKFKGRLNNMRKISVREDAGAKIVKKLTGRDAIVLPDPTLLIEKKRWEIIMSSHKYKPTSKYILTYLIGDVDPLCKKYIKRISKEYNLKVVNLASYRDQKRYAANPSEFLDYINSAEIVVTNSFHATVFSIIFRRNFVVFGREGLNSRIDTLLSMFKLENRRSEFVIRDSSDFEVDFSNIDKVIAKEKSRVNDFLRDALKNKEMM